jgi:F-type H+-transporting ATPase subunit gamma
MARIREIRSRVAAIKKTQKITSAMKMISAARLARAQQAAEASRPYGAKLREVLASVAGNVEADAHPLLAARPGKRKLDVLLFTSDRGLCGAFNANLIKTAQSLVNASRDQYASVSVIAIGRRGRDFVRRRRIDCPRSWVGVAQPTPELAHEIAEYAMERFSKGESDEMVVVFSRFVSAIRQEPSHMIVLPVRAPDAHEGPTIPYEIEPDPVTLLAAVLPGIVEFAVLRALLENAASEHGARMSAMESATENTRELIRSLTLDMNKARQTQITTELTEIVAGAEAL